MGSIGLGFTINTLNFNLKNVLSQRCSGLLQEWLRAESSGNVLSQKELWLPKVKHSERAGNAFLGLRRAELGQFLGHHPDQLFP